MDPETSLNLTADIVTAMVSNNTVAGSDLPRLIATVHEALSVLDQEKVEEAPSVTEGAVTARKSLSNPDRIISMIDGKPYKTLRRHIAANGMTEAEYRERYGLKADYPMVAPGYSAIRKALAKKIGLGRKKGETSAVRAAAKSTTRKPGRPAKATSTE